MKFWLLIFSFLLHTSSAFCQNSDETLSRALRMLAGKTWIRVDCKKTPCYLADSDYFLFPKNFMSKQNDSFWVNVEQKYAERRYMPNLHCVQMLNYKYGRDYDKGGKIFVEQLCRPVICFCDSSKNKNTYNVYSSSWGSGYSKGTLTFLSDSEYYYYQYGGIVHFKAIKTPKEVLSVMPK